MELSPRIQAAANAAQQAFWAAVAQHFPEIKTGDFPPEITAQFDAQCERAVTVWVDSNAPHPELTDQMVEIALGDAGYQIVPTKTGFFFEVDGYGSPDHPTAQAAIRAAYHDLTHPGAAEREKSRV